MAPKRKTAGTAKPPSPTKRSKRISDTKTRKSADYAEEESSPSEEEVAEQSSAYEDNANSPSEAGEETEPSDFDDDDVSAARRPKAKKNTIARGKAQSQAGISAKNASRPGKTGLGPGTQVIMKRPTARDAGKTPYEDHTIHRNTLLFLGDLARNNDRSWFKSNDLDFRASSKDWETYADSITQRIVEIDDTVPELPFKDLNFRIYRDVRFSKNKLPYKTSFGAAWSRTGRKGPYAVYYIQIKPNGNSMVAGGLWQPEADAIAKLRRDIDRRPQRLKAILSKPAFRKEFLDDVKVDEKKVVAKFVQHNQENALKTKPKGFESDHKDIALLRLRNFVVSRKLDDGEITGLQSLDRICTLVAALVPFVHYLNSVVMPDEPSDGDDQTDQEDDEDDEEDGESQAGTQEDTSMDSGEE